MSRNGRLVIKLLLILAGMLIIGYILTVSIRMNRVPQPEGNYIRLRDVMILTEALDENFTAVYDGDERYTGWKESLEADGEALLTYGQFLDWMDMVSAQTEGMGDGREWRQEFGKKYRKEHFVLAQDWYSVYEDALEKSGMQDTIVLTDVTVLGIGSEVSDGTDRVLAEDTLLAEEGIFSFRSDEFASHKYQVLRVYRKGGELLTVREVVSRGMDWKNVWIMEAEEGKRLQAFYGQHEIWLSYEQAESPWREQIADLDFADGKLQSVKIKEEKISGKLLSVRDGIMEIEGAGKYPCNEDMKVYKLYGNLTESGRQDLRIGYDFTDFVLDGGSICAGLLTRDEAMENIRVVIKNTGYAGAYHEEVRFTSDTDFTLRYGEYDAMESREYHAGDVVTIDRESEYFKGDRIYIEPGALTGKIRLLSVERSQGNPSYRGKMEIAKTPEGLVIVNELLLEEYLYSVVPSEMPASYPLEALKAQAVCARTYAVWQMQEYAYPQYEAHVNDSVTYQVYNQIDSQETTRQAVEATAGQIMLYEGRPVKAYYFATSCGSTTDENIWEKGNREQTPYIAGRRTGTSESVKDLTDEDTFAGFIRRKHAGDLEISEPWYRWNCYVSLEQIGQNVRNWAKARMDHSADGILWKDGENYILPEQYEIGTMEKAEIVTRNTGGAVHELLLTGSDGVLKVKYEYNIRLMLGIPGGVIHKNDGSEGEGGNLLPSGYFVMEPVEEDGELKGYRLWGGGLGHGAGMSQNGARVLAEEGCRYDEILQYFYHEIQLAGLE